MAYLVNTLSLKFLSGIFVIYAFDKNKVFILSWVCDKIFWNEKITKSIAIWGSIKETENFFESCNIIFLEIFYCNSTLNFGILPVLIFQVEVYYKVDRLLMGLTAQQKVTSAQWYSNKTSLYLCFISLYLVTLKVKTKHYPNLVIIV